ncbi:MAG TPA: hypothetical protein VG267_16605 [Terracidiphilus sp.]|jgi:hypothetical protein|nr:hypothetical protein [Terracidiphilus sp.]
MRFRFVLLPKAIEMNVVKSCRALNFSKMRVLISLLALTTVIPLCGQTADQAPSTPTPKVRTSAKAPLPRLYWHFLDYQRFLDKKADEQEKKGLNGTEIRETLQRRLGFNPYQLTLIREAAQKMANDLNQKDAQAKDVIDEFRKKYPPNLPLTGSLPPPPPELTTLQQEREDLIEQHVATLKSELGPDASQKLDSFLLNDFAQSVTTRPASVPSSPLSSQGTGQAEKAVRP